MAPDGSQYDPRGERDGADQRIGMERIALSKHQPERARSVNEQCFSRALTIAGAAGSARNYHSQTSLPASPRIDTDKLRGRVGSSRRGTTVVQNRHVLQRGSLFQQQLRFRKYQV